MVRKLYTFILNLSDNYYIIFIKSIFENCFCEIWNRTLTKVTVHIHSKKSERLRLFIAEQIMQKDNKNTIKAIFKAAVAMIIFIVAVVNYDKLKNIDIRALVESSANVFIAVGSIIGIYFVKSVLFIIPASLIYISVGTAFAPWQAILINLSGIVLEVVVTYLLGIFLGGDYVNKLLSKNKAGKKILETEVNNKFSVLLAIRFLPVFPIDFVSLFWGASKCKFPKYFFASVLGIMPRVILFTILGDGIYNYIPIHLLVKIIICAIPVGVVVYLISHFFKKRKVGQQDVQGETQNETSPSVR